MFTAIHSPFCCITSKAGPAAGMFAKHYAGSRLRAWSCQFFYTLSAERKVCLYSILESSRQSTAPTSVFERPMFCFDTP